MCVKQRLFANGDNNDVNGVSPVPDFRWRSVYQKHVLSCAANKSNAVHKSEERGFVFPACSNSQFVATFFETRLETIFLVVMERDSVAGWRGTSFSRGILRLCRMRFYREVSKFETRFVRINSIKKNGKRTTHGWAEQKMGFGKKFLNKKIALILEQYLQSFFL